jgi:ATP-dependent RNA helicase RhlE
MYNKFDKQRSFGGNRPSTTGSRPGGFSGRPANNSGRPNQNNRFSRNNNRRGGYNHTSTVDVSRLVKKAVPQAEVETYVSKHTFNDFAIDQRIKENIASKGYVTPTPIQDQTIPQILEGKDVVGIANTGTGKSGAFLIPLIHKVVKANGTKVLVVVPTRELAMQIHEELNSFSFRMGVNSVLCVGGMNINAQIRNLYRRHDFVIGTPGRLKDLIERNTLKLNQFNTIVLDEVDRMLDMGFIHDIKFLISKFPENRHSLFFSATLSSEIKNIIKDFATPEHITVSVKTGETAANVDQDVINIYSQEEKMAKLHELLSSPEFKKAIVFVRTKRGAERIAKTLERKDIKVDSIHGDKRQTQRQRAIQDFKAGRINALIATDVAARGLDIADVTHVINYDLPATQEDYTHRIGRTGRGGKTGIALTFVEKYQRVG